MLDWDEFVVDRERFHETLRNIEREYELRGYAPRDSSSGYRRLFSGLGARLAAYGRSLHIRPGADQRATLPDCGTPDTAPC